ncbi:pentapeptide repeat-containing protein [Plantactinospora sp. S1510]|uniref:Pentapeptide repeat-containing protein n=1 Tax=Plantactinospora alkalitolerans TaxID=2789879 RepID=A0ABS0H7F0_9ACTN|nr:pentapeptide repeat-containing protein [Plantactinospora alkalitolerans]
MSDLPGATKQSFAGLDLRHRSFDQHFFKLCDFRGANLRGASMRGARFAGCDLRNADLRDTDLCVLPRLGRVIRGVPDTSPLPYVARMPAANARCSPSMSAVSTRQEP